MSYSVNAPLADALLPIKGRPACRYGDYAAMFLKLLKDTNEEVWDIYYVFEKDSPTDETLAKYKVSACLMHVNMLNTACNVITARSARFGTQVSVHSQT